MEKKEYTAPKMDIIEMKLQAPLLDGSGDGAPDATEYDGEFGFNSNSTTDRKA